MLKIQVGASHLGRLGPLLLGEQLVRDGALSQLAPTRQKIVIHRNIYLHSPSEAEDTVVGVLWRQALESLLDDIIFFGEQIIGPVETHAVSPSIAHFQKPSR